ncbi:hypothetical protein Q2432_27330, partial [Escherichia coli]|nr:hypothetical protein [Escherichia coli]
TTNTRGFFLSKSKKKKEKILGVVVEKISLNKIKKAGAEGPKNIIVKDKQGFIFLSKKPPVGRQTRHPFPFKKKKKQQSPRQY